MDERYKDYEELIIKKEQLLKDAHSYHLCYLQNFGELMTEILQTKIDCIRLKKTITYCMRCINMGEEINTDLMNAQIDTEMQTYYQDLEELIREKERADDSKEAEEFQANLAKKIFRRIAKKLHPDINAKTGQIEELSELWDKVMIAYRTFNVDALQEYEVLLNHIMTELGEEGFAPVLENIEELIQKAELQIAEIISTVPYTYGELLKDEEAVKVKKLELQSELDEFTTYKKELEETLEKLTGNGGAKFTWQMIL